LVILEQLFAELGYRDYLSALQRYRAEHPEDIHLLTMSSYLVDYPFADRLYPDARSTFSSPQARTSARHKAAGPIKERPLSALARRWPVRQRTTGVPPTTAV
jgi:hypothetical protein